MVSAAESQAPLHEGASPLVCPPNHGGTFPPFPLSSIPPGTKSKKIRSIPDLFFIGAGGRNRTDMELPPEDFESSASTSFTTPARGKSYTNHLLLSSKKACNFLPGFV